MYTPQEILDAAKTILPALPKLLDESTAIQVQGQLNTHLAAQDLDSIWETLERSPQTQRWRSKYLDQRISTRSSSELAGDRVAQPSGLIYACPHCDYRDVVFLLGMNPDPCPTHPDAVLDRVKS